MIYSDLVKQKVNEIDVFIGICMLARDYSNSGHLATRYFANHKSFDTIFENLPVMTDRLGESFFGSDNEYNLSFPSEVPSYLKALLYTIISQADNIYDGMCDAGETAEDDINALCMQTKY